MATSPQEKIVITRDMVFDEADRLKASGVEPTNRKLLHELGGSMTTIAGFLRDWKAKQSIAVPGPVETLDVPTAVVDAGNQAVGAIWQACHAEARREIEAVTEKANQRIKEAEADRDSVLTELAQADAELTAERTRAAALDGELIALREVHVTMQEQNEHLVTEEQKAKAVAEEIARRADDLDASHKHERDRADKLAEEMAALQPVAQRAITAESTNEALRAEAARVRDELAAERTQREALAKAERAQATDLAKAEAQAAALAAQLDEAKRRGAEQLDELKKHSGDEIARLSERAQNAEREREAARQDLAASAQASSKLAGQVEALQHQVAEQTATLRVLTPKADAGAAKGARKGEGKGPTS